MWQNPQETVDLVTFTEEILNGKLHFFCAVILEQLPNTTFLKTLRYDYYLFYAADIFLYPLKIPENLWYRKKNNQGGGGGV